MPDPVTRANLLYIRLVLQSSFSLIVCFTCVYKIITAPDEDQQRAVYWSALTATAAQWMPSPTRQADEETNNRIAGDNITNVTKKD